MIGRQALWLMALILAASAPAGAESPGEACDLAETGNGTGIHAAWDRYLKTVAGPWGGVDYGCAQAHRDVLDRYRSELAAAHVADMGRAERISLWINAYNAFTIELILRHWPGIDGIRDIPSSQRWKLEAWEVGGETYSLDQIEHEILRPNFDEPRVHFALNCASVGCPALRAEAYVADALDGQLEDATRNFLRNSEKGARTGFEEGWFGGRTPTLWVSSIFDWFEEDFVSAAGSVRAFVEPYLAPDDRSFVERHEADLEIEHLEYDWSLNETERMRRIFGPS
jgi:hypothetical protein